MPPVKSRDVTVSSSSLRVNFVLGPVARPLPVGVFASPLDSFVAVVAGAFVVETD